MNWILLKDKFIHECTDNNQEMNHFGHSELKPNFVLSPLSVFDWFKKQIINDDVDEVKLRSNQQNRALRLYWKLLSQSLNSEGCTYMSSRGKELKFTTYKIENDWREMMLEMYGIESTKDLTTEMINEIYDCMNLEYSQNYGIFQEFPSLQRFLNNIDSGKY